MEQLTLFPLPWQEVIPLDAQPWVISKSNPWSWGVFGCSGDWVWNVSPGTTVVSTYPERLSSSFYSHCPFKPGRYFRKGVITEVVLMHISLGWVWVVKLRELSNDDDFDVYWDMLQGIEPSVTAWPEDYDDYDDCDDYVFTESHNDVWPNLTQTS